MFCIFLIAIILAVAIPSRLNTSYYHMIDDEDYRAFVWIRDNIDSSYEVALVDPWKATAFVAITGKKVRRRIFGTREPVDDTIYQFLRDGCPNTAVLRDDGISIVYSQWPCSNPDLVEVSKNVYLTNPNLSLLVPGGLRNAGFEAITGDHPAWWTWSENCKPNFLYPEPGRGGGSGVGIMMSETEPFEPWPAAIWGQSVPVEVGRSYRIGGWVRTESIAGSGGAMIVASWSGPGDNWISATEFMSYVKGTQDWTYYEGVVTAPAGATVCTVCCLMGGCSGTAWFDDIVFGPSGSNF